jgi:hypothetical protein
MQRGSPGGLLPILCASALSFCFPGTSFANAAPSVCAMTGLQLGDGPACQIAPAEGSGKLELNAEASDSGFFWAIDNERSAGAGVLALTTGPAIDRSISFQATGLSSGIGELDLHGGVGATKSSDALTFERLRWGDTTRQDNTSIGVGLVERLLGGRLTIASNLAWSSDAWTWTYDDGSFEYSERTGLARAFSADAKIIQTADLQWSVRSEISSIDDNFVGSDASWQSGGLPVRGDRTKISSQFSAFGLNGSGSFDHMKNSFADRSKNKVQFEVDGISATIYATTITRFSLTEPDELIRRSDTRGVTLELAAGQLLPDLASSPLVPRLVSLNVETGHLAEPGQPVDDTSAYQILADWKTALGTTTALYWLETQGQNLPGMGGQGESSQMFDIAQAVRLGLWKFTFGATATDLEAVETGGGFADNAISGRFSIRYAPAFGPHLEASFGRTHDQFDMMFDDLLQRSQATRLSLSVDLSDYVQQQLGRRDTHLSFDFRHEFNEAEFEQEWGVPPEAISRSRDTALLSFRTPL